MNRFINIVGAIALTSPFGILAAQEASVDAQIAEAVSPLPESLRAGATVEKYDTKGDPVVLRKGTNGIVCMHDWPLPNNGFSVTCAVEVEARQRHVVAKFLAQGKSHDEAIRAAQAAGSVFEPATGSILYSKTGKTAAEARVLWRIRLPNANANGLGLPTQRENGSPWIMLSGTPNAHLMIPVRETSLARSGADVRAAQSSAQSQTSADEISNAVSPLPESLRAGATVKKYDHNGNATVIREGTNGLICVPNRPTPDQAFYVECFPRIMESDYLARNKIADGKASPNARKAVWAAVSSGKLREAPVGTMTYRKAGSTATDARVLWILVLPNLNADALGVPIKPENGSPWMMLSGTPNAHLMIPVNDENLRATPDRQSSAK